jgi:hypothetical protein
MGDTDLQAETREKVKKETVMKIHGQPMQGTVTLVLIKYKEVHVRRGPLSLTMEDDKWFL